MVWVESLRLNLQKKPEEDCSYLPHIPKSKEGSSITEVEKLLLQKVDYEKQTKFASQPYENQTTFTK